MHRRFSPLLALLLAVGLTLGAGAYHTSASPTAVCGDLNGDGKVDIPDISIALRIAVGLINPTPAMIQSGDVNGDGKVNVLDALLLLKAAVGLAPAGSLKCATPVPTISYANDIQPIWENGNCTLSACHGPSFTKPADQPEVLVAGQSYQNIVNVPAVEAPSLMLVNPGHPESSYLLDKVKGIQMQFGMPDPAAGTNDQMPQLCDPTVPDPQEGGCLTSDQINKIQAWIAEGAPNN